MDYKEKLRLAKEALDSGSYDKETIEYIFPELKENDDTRVKNKLIEFFKGYYPDKEWWGNITQGDILAWFEEHDEQNTTDKEEPKFKVGDIVRNIDSGELFHIEKVDSRNYWDGRDSFCIINQEQWERVEQKSSWSKEDEMQLDAAIHLVSNTGHIETANWLKDLKNRVQPQQKWSEEDEMMIKFTLTYFRTRGALENSDIIKWFKSLKEKIQSQPKHEWSEEDKKMKDAIYSCVDSHYEGLAKTSLLIWLKSLKDRVQPQSAWKPSDEQFKLLKHIMENVPLSYRDKSEVGELYLDLKRLGGE